MAFAPATMLWLGLVIWLRGQDLPCLSRSAGRCRLAGPLKRLSFWTRYQQKSRLSAAFVLVAGAGSNLHLLPEQVKMVAGTGVDHNLQSTPVKMVAGGCNHLNLRSDGRLMRRADVGEVAKQVKMVSGICGDLHLLFQSAA